MSIKIENIAASTIYTASRIDDPIPCNFRLVRRGNELILQGWFRWCQGSDGGFEWRDIPTIIEEQS